MGRKESNQTNKLSHRAHRVYTHPWSKTVDELMYFCQRAGVIAHIYFVFFFLITCIRRFCVTLTEHNNYLKPDALYK